MQKIKATINFTRPKIEASISVKQPKIQAKVLNGVSGRSAYKIAVEKGFVGTIEEWLESLHGKDGKDGQEVELRVDNGYIQWKYENSGTWNSLISLNDLKGADGEEVSLQKSATHVQWKLGNGSWQNLVALSDLKGQDGYTPQKGIDYFDGVDGYTPQKGIDYFDGQNGKGIVSILKTNTTGLIDTYTVSYTDSTTSTFKVTNGQDGNEGATPYIQDGFWYINGVSTGVKAEGIDGEGTGDMLASVYDPKNKKIDVFDIDNMTESSTKKIMTSAERTKLSGIEENANNYSLETHGDDKHTETYLKEHQDISHLAAKTEIPTKVSELTNDSGYLTSHQDISHLVENTDSRLSNDRTPLTHGNDKHTENYLTSESDPLFSASEASNFETGDKTKLDGIEPGANKYIHPTKHDASIITQTPSYRFVTDSEKINWNAKAEKSDIPTNVVTFDETTGNVDIPGELKVDGNKIIFKGLTLFEWVED